MAALLVVDDLKMKFTRKDGVFSRQDLWAVSGVSFHIDRGETLGLVGESGCGKSTTGRCVVRLLQPTGGKVLYDGADVARIGGSRLRPYRRRMQMVFQDPTDSLNPRMTVKQVLSEVLWFHFRLRGAESEERVMELMELVGLKSEHLERFPHQLSVGQQQRVGVARAVATEPEFLVLDEPTSALDVSVRGRVLQLLADLRQRLGLSYLFISHDLSVIKHLCRRIAVMYLGAIVELAGRDELFSDPVHPYTQALLSAVPIPDPDTRRRRIRLEGEVPSPTDLPSGCLFASRCSRVMPRCRQGRPPLTDRGDGHLVACFLE